MRSVRDKFLHYVSHLGELVHEAFLVVQTACGIDYYNISVVSYRALECVESH